MGDESESSDDTTRPWMNDVNGLKAEIGQISYVLKNIAAALDNQRKKDRNVVNTEDDSEQEDVPRNNRKGKNDDEGSFKLDIPEFNGELDAERFLDWVRQVERIFEYKDYDEHKKFKIATLKLTKYTSLWYENLKKLRKRDKKSKIETWEKLKKHLTKRFLPRDYEQEQYLKLTSLAQEGSSVADYVKEFERLSIVCDLEEKEELRTARFIRGLNPTLQQRVEIQNYEGFDDVCRLALKFEKQDKGKKAYSRDYGRSSGGYSKPTTPLPSIKEVRKEDPRDKGKGPMVETRDVRLRRCFKCQGYGHIANECPQKRALTITELSDLIPNFVFPAPEPNPDLQGEDDSNEEVHFVDPYSDEEKEVLVIRNLHTEAAHIEEEQRERLFHSRCKAGAMLGDAFLHQLPHAFGNGGHSHGHGDHDHSETSHSHSVEDLSVGLSILFGIVVFLIVEKVVRYVEEFSGGEHSGTHTHHHHHKNSKKLKADEDSHKQSVQSQSKEKFIDRSIDDKVSEPKSDLKKRNKSNDGKRDKDASNRKRGEAKSATQPSNRVFGYLNLFSDGVHNFTDGIALGSAFLLYGSVGGWSRTLFLLAHEIPQEVGDFGILVRSGFSVSKALFFNFLSALVALAGTALALLLGQDPGQSSLIEGFTSGGFIYISVAGVLAEMNNNGSPSLKSSALRSLMQQINFKVIVLLKAELDCSDYCSPVDIAKG